MLRDETTDLYEAHQATPFMERLSQPEDRSNQQLRRFEREGWILARGRGAVGAKLYFIPDIGAAVGLAALQATVADREIMRAASRALYEWQPGQEEQEYYPITGALYGTANQQMWILEARILRDANGKKIVRAFCYDSDDRRPPFDAPSISMVIVNLSHLLIPLSIQLCRAMMGAEAQN
jgi:hypothetical protein